MNCNDPGRPDEALSKVLKEWRVNAPLPPHFEQAVWRRIERMDAPATPALGELIAHWIGTALARPILAASYLAVLLAIGVTTGWAQGRQHAVRSHDELAHRYVRSLDPYQAPRQ